MENCEKCKMPLAEEHTCPHKGMFVDDLLKLYPRELFVKKPTINVAKESLNDEFTTLIVVYHYDGVDIRLEYAESSDTEFPLNAYFVQEVICTNQK